MFLGRRDRWSFVWILVETRTWRPTAQPLSPLFHLLPNRGREEEEAEEGGGELLAERVGTADRGGKLLGDISLFVFKTQLDILRG